MIDKNHELPVVKQAGLLKLMHVAFRCIHLNDNVHALIQ